MIPKNRMSKPKWEPTTWHQAIVKLLEEEGSPFPLKSTGRVWALQSKTRSTWKVHYVIELTLGGPFDDVKVCTCEAGQSRGCSHPEEIERMRQL